MEKKNIKVRLTDRFSGRYITLRVNKSEWENRESNYGWLTDSQRRKVEDYFGKVAAYYTRIEVEQ